MRKQGVNIHKRDDKCRKVAESMGVSERYVRMVRSGERTNEIILTALMELQEAENQILEEVKRIVPINAKVTRKGREINLKPREKGVE